MQQSIEIEQEHQFDSDEDINLDDLEMPQLVRRNGMIFHDEDVQSFIILDSLPSKIYESNECPICLSSDEELYPLRCGHKLCQNDIQILIKISEQNHNLIQCPLCRAYQSFNSFEEVSQLKNSSCSSSLCHAH